MADVFQERRAKCFEQEEIGLLEAMNRDAAKLESRVGFSTTLRANRSPNPVRAYAGSGRRKRQVAGIDRFRDESNRTIREQRKHAAWVTAGRRIDPCAGLRAARCAVGGKDGRDRTIARATILPALSMATILGNHGAGRVFIARQVSSACQWVVRRTCDGSTQLFSGRGDDNFRHHHRIAQAVGDVAETREREISENTAHVLIGLRGIEVDVAVVSHRKTVIQWRVFPVSVRTGRREQTVGRTDERIDLTDVAGVRVVVPNVVASRFNLVVSRTRFNEGKQADKPAPAWVTVVARPIRSALSGRQRQVRVVIVVRRQAELFEIVRAAHTPSRFTCLLHGGKQQRDQNTNDGDHHKKLDEGKPSLFHNKIRCERREG